MNTVHPGDRSTPKGSSFLAPWYLPPQRKQWFQMGVCREGPVPGSSRSEMWQPSLIMKSAPRQPQIPSTFCARSKQLCNHLSSLGRKWLILHDFFFFPQKQIWSSGCNVTPSSSWRQSEEKKIEFRIQFSPSPLTNRTLPFLNSWSYLFWVFARYSELLVCTGIMRVSTTWRRSGLC